MILMTTTLPTDTIKIDTNTMRGVAALALVEHHGSNQLSLEDAEALTARLGIDRVEDLAYIAANPGNVAQWRSSAAHGWVVWFEDNDSAVAVDNGDPWCIEYAPTLQAAVGFAKGAGLHLAATNEPVDADDLGVSEAEYNHCVAASLAAGGTGIVRCGGQAAYAM